MRAHRVTGKRREAPRNGALAYETNNYSPRLAPFYEPATAFWPPLAEQLEAAARAGFGRVVLDSGSLEAYLRQGGSLPGLRARLDVLSLHCLAVAEISLVEDTESVIGEARPLLDAARALEAPYLQASVMGVAGNCLESARALEQLAAAAGATVALEFLPFSAVNSITAAQAFVRAAELCNTRLLLDSWHFFQGPSSWEQLRRLWPQQIAYLQFSDHAAIGVEQALHATVNERLLPGEGVFDLARFCAELRGIGFDGVLSCEVLSSAWRERTPAQYALAEFAAARRYWGDDAGNRGRGPHRALIAHRGTAMDDNA